jgi:hypothetical protein
MNKLAMIFGVLGVLVVPHAANSQNQQGLVNVNITDVTVQIPIAVAANICGVAVNVLVSELEQGPVDCQAGAIALAEQDGGNGNRPARQRGLINVNITDVDVQVPIAIAANICGVAVNVLVQELTQGPVDCTTFGRSAAVTQ